MSSPSDFKNNLKEMLMYYLASRHDNKRKDADFIAKIATERICCVYRPNIETKTEKCICQIFVPSCAVLKSYSSIVN